ncbi:hypothetical protein LJR68_27950 [Bacillus thuringiensis]|nr:hypothetical protein [Bacillus thuringiensis]
MRELIPFFEVERGTISTIRGGLMEGIGIGMVHTHGIEMLSVRERNMRAWKLKKKLDDKENELTYIKRKIKEGMDAERKKLDNRKKSKRF